MTTWQTAFVVHRAVDGRLHVDSVEVIEYDDRRLAIRGGCAKLCDPPGASEDWVPLVRKEKVYPDRALAEARLAALAEGPRR